MKKTLAITLLLVLQALPLMAQKYTISGTILEKDTKEAVMQASIQLLTAPDSTYVNGVVSNKQGNFSLPPVNGGQYILKVSYIGYKNKFMNLHVTGNKNVGTIALEPDAILLKEAVVTAEAPQVQVKEDTLVFNSSAYRTPEGAMLEELVKKLPGAEISDDGTIKINGKEVKKIMVNGKEFFGGDVKTGIKNLPAEMVDKLKTYDKKSDLARITGIDDGEEETVLDLTVKKGMAQGWFGNADLGVGNKKRYTARGMLNRFDDGSQISLIASANNTNDMGFSGGGGGPRFRRNEGLTAQKMVGLNFAKQTDKVEFGGSIRYNYTDNDVIKRGYDQMFLTSGNSYSNSNSLGRNKNPRLNIDFRLEWKPDSLTNIIFRPNFSYAKTNNRAVAQTGTFSDDPFEWVENPNDYIDLAAYDTQADPLGSIRINAANSTSKTQSHSTKAEATLQVNRRLNSKGRNLTFRGRWGFNNNTNKNFMESRTRYFLLQNYQGEDSILVRNQYIHIPTNTHTYLGQVTYSEPIARATYLQFSYQLEYKYNTSNRKTYDLQNFDWNIDNDLPAGYETHEVDSLGKYAKYKYFNHQAMVSLRFIRTKYQLNAGITLQPQHTVLSYRRSYYEVDTTRNVFNFSPNVDLRVRFSKVSQLRFNYRGRSSQPDMEDLLPIVDNSNPQNIVKGNPGLKPSFTHRAMLMYNTYNQERQRGMSTFVMFSATQNGISSSRTYIRETGGWITQPKNINGNWNINGNFMYNSALRRNQKFTYTSFTNIRYTNNVGYLTDDATYEEQKNTTTDLLLSERLNGSYRNDWLEIGINGSISYEWEKDKLRPDNNQEPYTFSYGANTTITFPWNMSFTTNITNQSRRGYDDSSMNRNELIWNAQLAQSFLKGAASLSVEWNDILHQQSNIMRSLTSSGRSVYTYNGVNSYFMVHFIYRLNIMGSKKAREQMRERGERRGFGGPPPGGGFGGGRPPGGGGGRPF